VTVNAVTSIAYLQERTRVDEHGCWRWTAGIGTEGYGRWWHGSRRVRLAHRASYELLVGPIDAGLQLDHLCRVRECVNPAHLEPVSPRINLLRSEAPAAVNARKEACLRGHPFTEANTYSRQALGTRACRECQRQRSRNYQLKKAQAHTPKGATP